MQHTCFAHVPHIVPVPLNLFRKPPDPETRFDFSMVSQVKKLDGHVLAQKAKLEAARAEASIAAEAHSKLQAQVTNLGGELARQRLINRQIKTEHMAQMAELAAQQHQSAGLLDQANTHQIAGTLCSGPMVCILMSWS